VPEKYSKRVLPGITSGTQLQEYGNGLLGMLVSDLRVSPEDFSGLSLYVIGEFLNELFKAFHHTPVLTLLIANKPNSRCAS
jgi:hypothetical protein